jgi:hypothetical protein
MPNPIANGEYDIIEHVHRFSAWAASRAASAARGRKFRVVDGKAMIEAAGLRNFLAGPHTLPEPAKIDAEHQAWRKAVIDEAGRRSLSAVITDGVAAKLINIYLKAGLVTVGNCNDHRVGALHPPIDSVLLRTLAVRERNEERASFWYRMHGIGWSNFDSPRYEEVINKIRERLGPERPLWMIEEHFQGYRD